MSSIPAYHAYAKEVLMPAMDQDALAEIEALEAAKAFDDPRYTELLTQHYYVQHVLRMSPEAWPDPVNRAFAHINCGALRSMRRDGQAPTQRPRCRRRALPRR